MSPLTSSVAETGVAEPTGSARTRLEPVSTVSEPRSSQPAPTPAIRMIRAAMPTAGRASRPRSPCHQGSRAGAGVGLAAGASAASARTVAIRPSRRLSGGVSCSTEAGSTSTAGVSQRRWSRQASQPARWRSSAPRLVGRQRPERVGGEVVAPLVAAVARSAHGSTPEGPSMPIRSASASLIFSSPSRIRPFTVPSGIPSISAISEWLKPPK